MELVGMPVLPDALDVAVKSGWTQLQLQTKQKQPLWLTNFRGIQQRIMRIIIISS